MFDNTSLGNDLDLGQIVNRKETLRLSAKQRGRHLYTTGLTGTGKTKFLESLVRQDILNWDRSECGMMVLDPHGNLVDNLLQWLADPRYELDRRVVPIRLNRSEWVVGYNPLRPREATPSVVVANQAQAMAHVWGESDTSGTPRFGRWIANVLHTLYASGHTLAEAEQLLDREYPEVRRVLAEELNHPMVERDWRLADQLDPEKFEGFVESTVNRVRRFDESEVLKTAFGQLESLDLRQAMDEGWILLVDVSQSGGVISEEHARLFGTVLLSDLWAAGRERGKGDEGSAEEQVKPFYVFVDEFQEFVTPTLAKSLDQARGFGLHLTMAHQYPEQLTHEGEAGQKLYHSVMHNAANKVIFRTQYEESLKRLASWLFMGVMDPDKIKHELWSKKVMNYREEYRIAYNYGRGYSEGGGSHWSHAEGGGDAGSRSSTTGDSENTRTDPPEEGWLPDWSSLLAEDPNKRDVTTGRSTSEAEVASWSRYFADTYGGNEFWSESQNYGETHNPVLIPEMDHELSQVQFESLDEQLFRAMAALFDLKQRQCVARLEHMQAPVTLFTPTVEAAWVEREWVEEYVDRQLEGCSFAMPWPEAARNLEERKQALLDQAQHRDAAASEEPESPRRRVQSPGKT